MSGGNAPEPRPAAPTRDLDLAPDEAGREAPGEPATMGDLSDTRPFSLSELGLSDEEINSLGLGDISVPEQPAEAAAPESPSDEPDMTLSLIHI